MKKNLVMHLSTVFFAAIFMIGCQKEIKELNKARELNEEIAETVSAAKPRWLSVDQVLSL
jgi:hypothetical protein